MTLFNPIHRHVLVGLTLAAMASSSFGTTLPTPHGTADEAVKDAQLAAIRIFDSSSELSWTTNKTVDELSSAPQSSPLPLGSALGSIGNRRGDMDLHFGGIVGYPGRSTIHFDVGTDLADGAFGVMATDRDYVITLGRAGTLTNGTRLALAWMRPNGMLASEQLVGGRQTLDVLWTSNTVLSFTKAVGVFGTVGPVFLNRFYVLGQLDLPATSDGDSDFVALCLRFNGSLFEPCPDFGNLGNGMVRVSFDLGGTSFRKDIPHDLYVDQDNLKLLLAGTAQTGFGTPPGSDWDFAVARLQLFSGVLDTSFSSDGKRSIAFNLQGSTMVDEALSVHVRSIDNKIVVGGRANAGLLNYRSAMAQLNNDGSLDSGFCAPGVASCTSPSSHRSGRRLWNDDVGLQFSQVVELLGGGLAPTDTVVVREQVVNAENGRGNVSRVAADGGCSICTQATLQGFERIRPITAVLDFRFVPPFLFDFGVVVAGYGVYSSNDHRYTHVFRVLSNMNNDFAFRSGVVGSQQYYNFPTADSPRSEPRAMTVDSRGRYLIAGTFRWRQFNNDWDFALARLQHDVILAHGFDW